MTLLEYLKQTPEGDEVTVWDNTYDTEVYFYNNISDDPWDIAMMNLASKLNVINVQNGGVVVDLYDLIEENQERLYGSGLFYDADVDSIMDDMEAILAGNVSEDWFTEFVNILI